MKIKLPFGIRNGELVHIAHVEKGLACNCRCPSCGNRLVARKGDKTAHHFAHYRHGNCEHAIETALHLAAKQILEQEGKIRLPETVIEFNNFTDPVLLHGTKYISFEEVYLEERTGSIIPDVLLYSNHRPLCIEIRVTHEVSREKQEKIEELSLSTIEIDLSDTDRALSFDHLRHLIIDDLTKKQWIYNRKAEITRKMMLAEAEKKEVNNHGMSMYVEECPSNMRKGRGQYYAHVVDDCWHCLYCLQYDEENAVVYCGGRGNL